MGYEWRIFFPILQTTNPEGAIHNNNNVFDFFSSVVELPRSSWGAPEERTDDYYLFSNPALGLKLRNTESRSVFSSSQLELKVRANRDIHGVESWQKVIATACKGHDHIEGKLKSLSSSHAQQCVTELAKHRHPTTPTTLSTAPIPSICKLRKKRWQTYYKGCAVEQTDCDVVFMHSSNNNNNNSNNNSNNENPEAHLLPVVYRSICIEGHNVSQTHNIIQSRQFQDFMHSLSQELSQQRELYANTDPMGYPEFLWNLAHHTTNSAPLQQPPQLPTSHM